MGLRRNVGLKGFQYQGGGPMLSFMLHRICGLAMVLFVGFHISASFFMQQLGSDWATAVNTVYESIYFQVIVLFVVFFHALNGLRIIILDIWPQLLEYQREATWLQWLVFVPVYGLTVVIWVVVSLRGS